MKKLIEGLIILAIAAAVIVVALFGTTIVSGLTAISASVSAAIGGVITGGATLLTSWWSWSTADYAFTNYVGLAWLTIWGALFAYCGFKIATSDKKKWMNLVGRGSNYLGIILVLFLVAQPLIVSAGATYLADTTSYAETTYYLPSNMRTSYVPLTGLTNTTNTYTETNDDTSVFDNDTLSITNAALDFDPVTDATSAYISFQYLTEAFENISISKMVITWEYIGTGNLTGLNVYPDDAVLGSAVLFVWTTEYATTDITESGTVTIEPLVFQAAQITARDFLVCSFLYTDDGALPSDGDYFAVTMHVYSTSTILTQEFVMMILAGVIAFLDFIGILYATGAGPKYIW